jgi:type II secretory pathway pseudopilin PulG
MLWVGSEQEATMRRQTEGRHGGSGFVVLPTLIVFAIVGVVAAIGLPVYASGAKDTVLRQNVRTLEVELKSQAALDLEPSFVADDGQATGSSVAQGHAVLAIAKAIRASDNGCVRRFANPFSGSRAIVCQATPQVSGRGSQPAIWITDDQRYAYGAFVPSASIKGQLAGTLLVVVGEGGSQGAIQIFYVDDAGQRSSTLATLSL